MLNNNIHEVVLHKNNYISAYIYFFIITFFPVSLAAQNTLSNIFKISNSVSISIEKSDITDSQTEAIVNAANEQLLGGAGVCGAIFNAAGWDELQDACNKIVEKYGVRCPVGQACITDSFKLKTNGIKHIIHAVGPDCRIIKDETQQDLLLESAYKNSLLLADKNNIKSISFPFISSAIYAFPKERAADIALKTILEYANNNTSIISFRFVLFLQEDFDLFCDIAKKLLSY